jgi:hypothetical protein
MDGPFEAWRRLGALLIQRRVKLNPSYRSRQKFVADVGLNPRMLADIENARRMSFRPETVLALEHAYQWVPGSIEAVLAGGDPTPIETADPEHATGSVTFTASTSHVVAGKPQAGPIPDDVPEEVREAWLGYPHWQQTLWAMTDWDVEMRREVIEYVLYRKAQRAALAEAERVRRQTN